MILLERLGSKMDILSIVGALKTARGLADGLGMCRACHIRKRGLILECQSCGADLCAKCEKDMLEKYKLRNEMMAKANLPQSNVLICEACGKKWGEVG
jgi:hypothetical protein